MWETTVPDQAVGICHVFTHTFFKIYRSYMQIPKSQISIWELTVSSQIYSSRSKDVSKHHSPWLASEKFLFLHQHQASRYKDHMRTPKSQISQSEFALSLITHSWGSKDHVRNSKIPDQSVGIGCFFNDKFFRIHRPTEKQQIPDQPLEIGCFFLDTFYRIQRLCEQTA